MAQSPVTFDADLGKIVFSAKVNRLVRQDLRMGRMVGNHCGSMFIETIPAITTFFETSPQHIVFVRFYYDPLKNPYNRLLVVAHFTPTAAFGATLQYTLNNGASWTTVAAPAQQLAPWIIGAAGGLQPGSGEVEIDLSTIVAATWVGARVRYTDANSGALNWGAGILYHSSFPPF